MCEVLHLLAPAAADVTVRLYEPEPHAQNRSEPDGALAWPAHLDNSPSSDTTHGSCLNSIKPI